jgi:hypothetical protein
VSNSAASWRIRGGFVLLRLHERFGDGGFPLVPFSQVCGRVRFGVRDSERRGNLPEVRIAKRVGMGIWLVLWVDFAGSPPIALLGSVSLGSLCSNPWGGRGLR